MNLIWYDTDRRVTDQADRYAAHAPDTSIDREVLLQYARLSCIR